MNGPPVATVGIRYGFSLLASASGISCFPHATLVMSLLPDNPASYLSPFSHRSDQVVASLTTRSHHHLKVGSVKSRSLPTRRMALPLVVSLVSVFSVLLILVTLKFSYLKQRRLQTIHDLPNLLELISEEEEQESLYGRPTSLPEGSQRASDLPSVHSRLSGRTSYRSSAVSANNRTFSSQRRRPDSAPGFLVGFLGSPDWETTMQRTLADHHWRLRRESLNLSLKSPNRSTWHSHNICPRPRDSVSRSQPNKELPAYRRAGRHSSLRIPHVSSFGEMYADTFRGKKGRPKSLNTVVGQISSSRSGSFQTCSFGFSLSQRPSTVREAETPPLSLPLIQEGAFRLQVTDYSINAASSAKTVSTSPALEHSEQRVTNFGTRDKSPDIEVLTAYKNTNKSCDSSVGGSFGQMACFPLPPAIPGSSGLATPQFPESVQINSVHVAPRYLKRFYDDVLIWGDRKIGLGLDFVQKGATSSEASVSFSPLTVDLRWPALSELLVKELLNLDPIIPGFALLTNGTPLALGSDSPALRDGKLHSGSGDLTQTARLPPLPRSPQNRQHMRVNEHVPFSPSALPPAYPRSPRERTVRFAFENEEASSGQPTSRAESLVDLSPPALPPSLKSIPFMGSTKSSCGSSKITKTSVHVGKGSVAGANDIQEHDAFMSKEGLRLGGDNRDAVSSFVHELKPMLSNASLFLDLGGSSAGYEEEPSDFLSFDAIDFATGGTERSFEYSQASSSELIAVVSVDSDDGFECTVEHQTGHPTAE